MREKLNLCYTCQDSSIFLARKDPGDALLRVHGSLSTADRRVGQGANLLELELSFWFGRSTISNQVDLSLDVVLLKHMIRVLVSTRI